MKFYILTSKHIECLERHFTVLPMSKTVVVINSLDESYIDAAVSFCLKNNIIHYVTESDGTPATGKNSVLDLFLKSNDEYMVHIDGDDILTPYGVDLYSRLSKKNNAPDCLVLYRQRALEKSKNGPYFTHHYPFDKSSHGHQTMTKQDIIEYFKQENTGNYTPEKAEEIAEHRLVFNDIVHKYGESHESMCRIVFISRKCANIMHYDNTLKIGEDTIQFLKLKKIALSGGLNMVRYKEKRKPTYYYMQDFDGTVKQDDWDWIKSFNESVFNIELPPKYESLPEFLDNEVNK